jgi:hypothetical protein
MKPRRGWGVTLLILAFVLVAGAVIVRLAVYPSQLRFPADVDVSRSYEGDLAVMMNPSAIETGDLANMFLRDVPVTIERNVKVLEVGGDDGAIVQDAATMNGPAGPIMATEDVYAIDRTTMESIANFSDDPRVALSEGLVIGWPIGTEQRDYVGWNGDTFDTVSLTFAGEEVRGGIETYRFTAAGEPAIIVDPVLLETLPATLPKALLGQMAAGLGLPADQAAQFEQLLQVLPDQVPISYTYSFEKAYWVEPTTGVLVDVDVFESRAAMIQSPDGSMVPLAEIQQLRYAATPASIEDAVADANDAISSMRLFGQWVPGLALGLGLVLGAVGIWMLVGRGGATPTEFVPKKETLKV